MGELWCDTTEPETVFINDFFVYPACRGHGWGKAMLRAVEEPAGFTQVGPPKGGSIFLRKRYLRSPFLV